MTTVDVRTTADFAPTSLKANVIASAQAPVITDDMLNTDVSEYTNFTLDGSGAGTYYALMGFANGLDGQEISVKCIGNVEIRHLAAAGFEKIITSTGADKNVPLTTWAIVNFVFCAATGYWHEVNQ